MGMEYQFQQNEQGQFQQNEQGQFQQSQTASIPQLPLEELKKYFAPRKSAKTGITFVVIGALFCLGVVCNIPALLVVGAALIGIGGYLLANLQPRSSITDEQYDQWVNAQVRALIPRSLEKVGMDDSEVEDREPFILRSFTILPRGDYRADEVRWKHGRDGRTRFSVNICTIFWQGEDHLGVYRGDIVALNPQAHTERMWEYFYTDIVGVTANDEQDYISFGENQRYQYRFQKFSLRINNGETIDATVGADPIDNKQNLQSFHLPDSGVDQVLARLRNLLRTKKRK